MTSQVCAASLAYAPGFLDGRRKGYQTARSLHFDFVAVVESYVAVSLAAGSVQISCQSSPSLAAGCSGRMTNSLD